MTLSNAALFFRNPSGCFCFLCFGIVHLHRLQFQLLDELVRRAPDAIHPLGYRGVAKHSILCFLLYAAQHPKPFFSEGLDCRGSEQIEERFPHSPLVIFESTQGFVARPAQQTANQPGAVTMIYRQSLLVGPLRTVAYRTPTVLKF